MFMHQDTELGALKTSTLLYRYSIPAITSMLVVALYTVVDRIYIGQGLGPLAISGLALTLPVSAMIAAVGTLIGAGAAARVSIVLGKKDLDWARDILTHVPILTLIVSAIFIGLSMLFLKDILVLFGGSPDTIPYAEEYLKVVIPGSIFTNLCFSLSNVMRASGFPKKSMYTVLIGVILNIILDPIFIFRLDMGIRGAAVATVISMIVGSAYAFRHFTGKKHLLTFKFRKFRFKPYIIRNIVSIGLSPFLINFLASIINVIVNNQLYRNGGDLAIGAFGIINSYMILIVFGIIGLCQGMQPIVGYNYGAKNNKRVKNAFILTARVATIIVSVGFVAAEFFSHQMAAVFTRDPGLIDITANGLRITFLAFPLIGVQIVISNFFMSIGKAFQSILMTLSRQILFLVPLIYLLPLFVPDVNGVWYAIPISDFLAFLVSILFLLGLKRSFYPGSAPLPLKSYVGFRKKHY